MSALAHHDPVGYVNPLLLQVVYFLEKNVRVHHDPVADHVQRLRPEHAARYKVEAEFAVVRNDRMSGVISAGESRNHLRISCKIIYYLAFAFIAPLGSQDRVSRHP